MTPSVARFVSLSLACALASSACRRTATGSVSGPVDLAPPGAGAVRLVYLGVGGWIFQRGDQQVLAAPLFTHPSLVRTGLMGTRSDTTLVNRHMAPYDVSGAAAILVGHGHYDHLMDVPQVARRHAPRARILGSRTVKNTLGTWSGVGDRVLEVDSLAGGADRPGTWISLGPGLRVLPLRSHHAPHFDGRTLFQGTTDRPLAEEPRWAREWVDGPTYAFLLDFLDADGGVAFRIYYQDAVAAPPRGFAPDSLMRERPVDVAILVPATFDQVDWHPEALIRNLGPRWVILGHWENFFVPPARPLRTVPFTDRGHFQARLARVFEGESWLPELGTEFRFPTRSHPRSSSGTPLGDPCPASAPSPLGYPARPPPFPILPTAQPRPTVPGSPSSRLDVLSSKQRVEEFVAARFPVSEQPS